MNERDFLAPFLTLSSDNLSACTYKTLRMPKMDPGRYLSPNCIRPLKFFPAGPWRISHTKSNRQTTATSTPDCQFSNRGTSAADRICTRCFRCLPADQFRFRCRATGVRMHQCRSCHTERARAHRRASRARQRGWLIQKTASQIARSQSLTRSLALLEELIDAVGGPQKLIQFWRAECLKLTSQRRSSTRLARMYEMLVVLAGQVRHSSPVGGIPQ